MRRKVLLVALALGTIVGYASACRSHHHKDRHRAWKAEVADLCVSAAERRWNDKAGAKP